MSIGRKFAGRPGGIEAFGMEEGQRRSIDGNCRTQERFIHRKRLRCGIGRTKIDRLRHGAGPGKHRRTPGQRCGVRKINSRGMKPVRCTGNCHDPLGRGAEHHTSRRQAACGFPETHHLRSEAARAIRIEASGIDLFLSCIGGDKDRPAWRHIGGNCGQAVEAGDGDAQRQAKPARHGQADADARESSRPRGHRDTAEVPRMKLRLLQHLRYHGCQRLGMTALHRHPAAREDDVAIRVENGGRASRHGRVEGEELHCGAR